MKLATVLTPFSEHDLQLAAQCGVDSVTLRYPGPSPDDLLAMQQTVESHGLSVAAVEGYLPIEKIKTGTDHDGSELQAMQNLIRNMGTAGIPVLCYNFMAGTDWVRTQLDAPSRGGALTTAFDLADAERAVSLSSHSAEPAPPTSAKDLWSRLEQFLQAVLPVAEEAGVTLAMHPDDPPLSNFNGQDRIMNSVEAFERLVTLVPSPRNAVCFCVGTFVEMGVEIPQAIRTLGSHIQYVHFRDVEGTAESFAETFHDNGPTDMAEVMRALRDVGYRGAMRPDHVPQLVGEESGEPGYTMLGRLFAFGYMRGLMDATSSDDV